MLLFACDFHFFIFLLEAKWKQNIYKNLLATFIHQFTQLWLSSYIRVFMMTRDIFWMTFFHTDQKWRKNIAKINDNKQSGVFHLKSKCSLFLRAISKNGTNHLWCRYSKKPVYNVIAHVEYNTNAITDLYNMQIHIPTRLRVFTQSQRKLCFQRSMPSVTCTALSGWSQLIFLRRYD